MARPLQPPSSKPSAAVLSARALAWFNSNQTAIRASASDRARELRAAFPDLSAARLRHMAAMNALTQHGGHVLSNSDLGILARRFANASDLGVYEAELASGFDPAEAPLEAALGELDGENWGRGIPNRTKLIHQAKDSKRKAALEKARQRAQVNPRTLANARHAVRSAIAPYFFRIPAPIDPLDAALTALWRQMMIVASSQTAQLAADHIAGGKGPVEALAQAGVERALEGANRATGSKFGAGSIKVAAEAITAGMGEAGQQLAAIPAIVLLITEARAQLGKARPGGGNREAEPLEEAFGELESFTAAPRQPRNAASNPWLAAERLIRQPGPAAQPRPGPARPQASGAARQAAAAQLIAAVAPVLGATIDRAADPRRIAALVRSRGKGAGPRAMRAALVAGASRYFAQALVAAGKQAPPGADARRALQSVIGATLQNAATRYPIFTPGSLGRAASFTMTGLAPRLPQVARLAAAAAS